MSERQYQPSARRLRRARHEGKVIKSRVVSQVAVYIAVCLSLGPSLSWVRNGSLIQWLNYKVWGPEEALVGAAREGFFSVLRVLLPVVVAAVCAGLAQTKVLFLPSQLTTGFRNFRLGTYLSRVRQNCVEAAAGLGRALVLTVVLVSTLASLFFERCCVWHPRGYQYTDDWLDVLNVVAFQGVFIVIGLGAMSYALVRWKFFRSLKMSLHELKEEYREEEGDPHIRAIRKREHAIMLLSEIEKRVRRSKVVIVSRGHVSN